MKTELDSLFDNYKKFSIKLGEIANRGYVFSNIEQSKILFTGINPSFTGEAKPESFGYYPKEAVKLHHFGKMADLAEFAHFSNDWTFLDLFYIRETSQEIIWDLTKQESGLNFLCEQLRLTQNRIEKLKPEIIIVCNSMSRCFWGMDKIETIDKADNVWMGYDLEYNETLGVDIISGISKFNVSGLNTSNLLGTPVMFSSTLTYMDKPSLKRLGWHIKYILQNKEIHTDLFN